MFLVRPQATPESVLAEARTRAAQLRRPLLILEFHDRKSPALAIASCPRRHWHRAWTVQPQ